MAVSGGVVIRERVRLPGRLGGHRLRPATPQESAVRSALEPHSRGHNPRTFGARGSAAPERTPCRRARPLTTRFVKRRFQTTSRK